MKKKQAEIKSVMEKNNMTVRIKKSHTYFEDKTHTILTDDVFTYVDFYFKTHARNLKSQKTGKKIEENYEFYWQQARHFYLAAKQLPIESAPLPMYYAMLNAAKSLILFKTKDVDATVKNMGNHGLHEFNDKQGSEKQLDTIKIERDRYGVFVEFSKYLDAEFDEVWKDKGQNGYYSVKELMYQLAFIHRAYATTYSLPKSQELFIPLDPGISPTFYKFSDGKSYLVCNLQKRYFKSSAVNIPQDIVDSLPIDFVPYYQNDFRIVSKDPVSQKDIKNVYRRYRKNFQYIVSEDRLWYIKRKSITDIGIHNINSLSAIMAITHRFSEIVRYKPEQLSKLLAGKENWIIHEFINLALDQFFDEIACEITGFEIMMTRKKTNI
ncbi:MAG: hypothetical protein HUJ72_04535 [Blautia sp.]|nr:hypothetical protein [Blautia sp.]